MSSVWRPQRLRDAHAAPEAIGLAAISSAPDGPSVGEPIDHAVGVILLAKPGIASSSAASRSPKIHHRDGRGVDAALALLQ